MILNRFRFALVSFLAGLLALAADHFVSSGGVRLSAAACETVRGSDPFTYGNTDVNTNCSEINIVPYPYTDASCSATPNADIPANSNGCVRCDDIHSSPVAGTGATNVTRTGTVDCSTSNKFTGVCNPGANGKGACAFSNMPLGQCSGTLKLYTVQKAGTP